jgi:hypothetical protein
MCDEYTKPKERLKQSLKEMKLIREGKLTRKNWWELKKELEKENVNATIKKIDKTNITGLTSDKKQLLKKHMGSVASKIDMNKVREWWKSLFD